HLGQCLACAKEPGTKEQYAEITKEISQFLHGAYSGVKNDLIEKMKQASEVKDYERAIEIRENIAHIEALMEQKKIDLTENKKNDKKTQKRHKQKKNKMK